MKKLICLIIPLLFIFLFGCDTNVLEPIADDSSYEADLEEAKMALDDGNYDKSINLMLNHYDSSHPDPEATRVLSSAYMGKAGVDLTYIIEFSDAEDKDGYDVISDALALETTSDMIPQVLTAAGLMEYDASESDKSRYIDQGSIEDMLYAMNEAKTILQNLINYFNENNQIPEDDDIVKIGMASALDFIMKVSKAVMTVTGTNAPINKSAYNQVFPPDERNFLLNNFETYLSHNQEIIGDLIDDLINVRKAITVMIDVIGADEDITEDFDEFMREILGLDNFTPITDETIREYLTASQIMEFIRDELIN